MPFEEGNFLPRREIVYRLGSWPSRRMISGRILLLALMNQLQTYENSQKLSKKAQNGLEGAEKMYSTYLEDSKIGFSGKSHFFAIRRVGIVTVIKKPLFENFDGFFGQISTAFSSYHSRPTIGTSRGTQFFRAGMLIRRGTGITFTPSNN